MDRIDLNCELIGSCAVTIPTGGRHSGDGAEPRERRAVFNYKSSEPCANENAIEKYKMSTERKFKKIPD